MPSPYDHDQLELIQPLRLTSLQVGGDMAAGVGSGRVLLAPGFLTNPVSYCEIAPNQFAWQESGDHEGLVELEYSRVLLWFRR